MKLVSFNNKFNCVYHLKKIICLNDVFEKPYFSSFFLDDFSIVR